VSKRVRAQILMNIFPSRILYCTSL